MPPSRYRKLAWAALLITAAQILLALIQAPPGGLGYRYRKLCEWDSGWYEGIVSAGYHSSVPPKAQNGADSNVAFFPGYPLLARALHLGFGLDVKLSLLIVAQLACVAFWMAFMLILERWNVTPRLVSLAVLLLLMHPASFFLVMGYSESLFMASMLWFIFLSGAGSPRPRSCAMIPGFLMSATRIVGLPLCAYPAIRLLAIRGGRAIRSLDFAAAISVSALSAMGGLLFFAYCRLRFGTASLYMDTQRIGWGIATDYGALWKWREFNYFFPWDRFATIASGAAIAALFSGEAALLATGRRAPVRLPIHYCVFCLFYVTLAGLKSLWFRSTIRYSLPWYALILLCLAHLSTEMPKPVLSRWQARLCWLACAAACVVIWYAFQLPHLSAYLHSAWFA